MKTKIIMALLAGATMLAACKGRGSSSAADSARKDSIAATDSVQLVKTADMRIKVKDVQTAVSKVAGMTIECGGTVMHHDLHSEVIDHQDITLPNDSVKKLTVYNRTAELTVKIPSETLELFVDSVNRLSTYIDNQKMEVEDRTLDHLSEKLKIQNRDASVKLRSKIKLTQRVADSILILKDNAVDRKISNLRTEDASKYSTITLALYQNNTVSKEIVPSDNLSDYHSSLGVQSGQALSRGWYFFCELIIGLLHTWVFLVMGGMVWAGIYWYRKNKARAAKPNA